MKQYLITGRDFTDEGALARRMAVRPKHIEVAAKLLQDGNYILGGAILSETGSMIGSVMVLQFENEDELEEWKASEPYIVHQIWEKIDIEPFKVSNLSW